MRMLMGAVAATALATVFVACRDHPTSPGSAADQGTKTLTTLRVIGPASLPPGATGQFTAVATYSDNSTADVTTSAGWLSSRPDVLLMSSGGGGTAKARGEAKVSASFQRTSPSLPVLILETGTYRVNGRVRDGGSPLSGAVVEVVEGTGAGLRTTTGAGGDYALYGVAGSVQVRVTADGFEPQTRSAVVGDHTVSDFDLQPLVVPTDISGTWILTLTASSVCSDQLAEVARRRQFDVGINQTSTRAGLTIENPMSQALARFDARVLDRSLSVELWKFSYYGEPGHALFEQVGPGKWLGIAGQVHATAAAQEIRGTLDGEFVTYDSVTPRSFRETAACRSGTHEFVLRRR